MSTTQVHITIQELDNWSRETFGHGKDHYKYIDTFVTTMEQFPPRGLQQKLRPLVVDEAVSPEDIVLRLTDETTGEEFYFNPTLDKIYKLVYQPVEVDTDMLQGLLS